MKKILILSMSLLLLLTACGGGGSNSGSTGTGKVESTDAGPILRTSNPAEPDTLDPTMATSTYESWTLKHLFAGLMTYDENDSLAPGLAESYEVSEDGLTYTFKLREGLKWSDGSPLTATDFEWTWKHILNPETASSYAYNFYYLVGGEDYNSVLKPGVYYKKDDQGNVTSEVDKEVNYTDEDLAGLDVAGKSDDEIANLVYDKWLKEAEDRVGVKAVDDLTLEVNLLTPTAYFPSLVAHRSYFPICKAVAESNPDWAKSPSTFVCSGPFYLENWEHSAKISLRKNENFYNADKVKLGGIDFDILENLNTAWQNYENGDYGILIDPPQEVVATNVENKNPDLTIGKQISTYYYNFNEQVKPLNNKFVRQGLAYAINREEITSKITKGGQIPAEGLIPYGLKDPSGKELRELNGNLLEYNPEKAKELFMKGLAEEGMNPEDVKLVLLYNTDESHKKIAQVVQAMWKENLGIEIELENVDFNVKRSREVAQDYMISRAGWNGDYTDAMTMVDLFVTGGAYNNTGFSNEKYDELIKGARLSTDQDERISLMLESEKVLMDEMPICPVYYYTQPYFINPKVKGIFKPLVEYPSMMYAYFEE